MGRAMAYFFGLGPWGGAKSQISFYFNYKVNFKYFQPKFVCLLTNERYKHIRQGFHSDTWVMPQGWDFGVLEGSKIIFSEYGHVAYQIKGDDQ